MKRFGFGVLLLVVACTSSLIGASVSYARMKTEFEPSRKAMAFGGALPDGAYWGYRPQDSTAGAFVLVNQKTRTCYQVTLAKSEVEPSKAKGSPTLYIVITNGQVDTDALIAAQILGGQ